MPSEPRTQAPGTAPVEPGRDRQTGAAYRLMRCRGQLLTEHAGRRGDNGCVNPTCSPAAASSTVPGEIPMSDPTHAPAPAPPALTSEERLRAIASDHKRKAKRGTPPAAVVDGTREPGDLVDPVHNRAGRDLGRDQPL